MKTIQERYKSDPQKLQAEMMKLYKEHKFNPFGGCLPMLIQLPLFIGLFWAISDPRFMAEGDHTFLNFIDLKNTGVMSHAGPSDDGRMSISESGGGGFLGMGNDHIIAGPSVTFTLKKDGSTLEQKIPKSNDALTVLPKNPRPGVPLTINTTYDRLGMDGYEGHVENIEVKVLNTGTKEMEALVFNPENEKSRLSSQLETVPGKTVPHFDVLLLVLVFGATMVLSQKMMTAQSSATASDQQQMMMKFLPIIFVVFLFIFPIPAGVLLYMATNSVFQIFQTWTFNRGNKIVDDKSPPSNRVLDIKPDSPKA
jgi:YidC/Oxa1 family membrane protein insertase